MFEILKRVIIWETICISVPHSKFWETCPHVSPVIYVHVQTHIVFSHRRTVHNQHTKHRTMKY